MANLNEPMVFDRVTADNFVHPDALRMYGQYDWMSSLTPGRTSSGVLAQSTPQNHLDVNVLHE